MAQRINNNHSEHQNGSAPSSPTMSQSQPGGQSRQPVSYPDPGYPSPGLSSAQYAYPAPNNPQVNEPYRASPTGSNGSLSLPSMRSLDPLQQQTHQQHMASPLPPPVAQMSPYYHGNQPMPHAQYPNVTSDPAGQNMRYALPVPDNRVMSGGRHKKEIKRRTKTGCLTCRKRRIKCDEQHPACRNCQKSKRECLGYDPIFKQQPGPAPIQPAPSSAPSQSSISAPANPYGNQPSMIQAYNAQVPNMAYEQALSAGVSSPGSASQQFDYSSAIDPALEAVAPSDPSNADQFHQGSVPTFQEDLKSELRSPSPYLGTSDLLHLRGGGPYLGTSDSLHLRGGGPPLPSLSQSLAATYAYTNISAKLSSVDELLLTLAATPDAPSLDSAQIGEVKHLWYSVYVPGLENFLESKWFSVHGLEKLLNSKEILDQFSILLDTFTKTANNDPVEMQRSSNVEGRVTWSLISMVYPADASNGEKKEASGAPPATDDKLEAAYRLKAFEDLVCGRLATQNMLTKPVPGSGNVHRLRELEFWYKLGHFVTLPRDTAATQEIDETLIGLRALLDGRENRDVLYSIAVVNGLGHRVSEYAENEQPLHLDEQDARSRLAVAKRFIKDEANGNGTTNVVRHLCEVATRSWIPPQGSK